MEKFNKFSWFLSLGCFRFDFELMYTLERNQQERIIKARMKIEKNLSFLLHFIFRYFQLKSKRAKSNLLLRFTEYTLHFVPKKNVFCEYFLFRGSCCKLIAERPRSSNVDIFRHKNAVAREKKWNKQCQSRMIDFSGFLLIALTRVYLRLVPFIKKYCKFFHVALLCLNGEINLFGGIFINGNFFKFQKLKI